MQTIINILVFFIILGVIIMIHEFGHFITAKFFGVYCSEFSLGMGPKIFGKKKGETEYQIRALPIGGFVAMAGEADQEDNELMKNVPYERTLKGIKTWKKCIIMLAGVFMNFLLALVLLIGIYTVVDVQDNTSKIGTVIDDYGAKEAGLQAGDVINSIKIGDDEYMIASYSDITAVLANQNIKSEEAQITIIINYTRDDKQLSSEVKAIYNEDSDSYMIGIQAASRHLSFFEAIKYGFNQFMVYATLIFTNLGQLITNMRDTIGQLSGPVGIYTVTKEVTETGSLSMILSLTALLSTNIGMFNLLPIPGLDGCQVVFALIERAIHREIPLKVKYGLQVVGLMLVFALMIFVTINDIGRLF